MNKYYTTLARFQAKGLNPEYLTGTTITISGVEYHEFEKAGRSPNVKRRLNSISTGEQIQIC
jgi:hypothetical protein